MDRRAQFETSASRAVLWDLDGTLIDSEDYHWLAWRDAMSAENVALTRQMFLESFGQRNDRILATWLGPDVPSDRVRRIGDAKEARYRDLMRAGGLDWLPGAHEWVRRLGASGWRQAIASSAPRANVDAVLDVLGATSLFDATVSAEDVRAGKPAPDVFLAAAAAAGVPADRCVVVEDAPAGIEAARRAGMRSIGIRAAASAGPDVSAATLVDLRTTAFDELLQTDPDPVRPS